MTLIVVAAMGLIIGFQFGMSKKAFAFTAIAFLIVQIALAVNFVTAKETGEINLLPLLAGIIFLCLAWIGTVIRSHRLHVSSSGGSRQNRLRCRALTAQRWQRNALGSASARDWSPPAAGKPR